MQHLSSESLTALALGEDDAGSAHLDACATCRAEVATLRATLERVRASHVTPVAPPAGLWDRIAAAVDESPADAARIDPGSGGTMGADAAIGDVAPAARMHTEPRADEVSARRGAPRDVARRGSRRRRFSAGALVAACAASAAVAAVIASVVVTQLGGEPRADDVASAVLEPLTPGITAASAEVIEQDGQRVLVVDASALPDVEGYLDVWLLDENAQQMVSLGVMDGESIRLALPAGLDLDAFPIVDVSVEPFDGDPTHSGESLWRGALES